MSFIFYLKVCLLSLNICIVTYLRVLYSFSMVEFLKSAISLTTIKIVERTK